MRYLEEKKSNISNLIENQFPFFVQQNNPKFLEFLSSYYESLENKYQPLDIATNLIDYYNIGYYRPNQLVENTKLVGNLLEDSTEIQVEDTTGFPYENGYIKIDNEIIFYQSIDGNKFVNCVRGTSALVLESIPKSEIVLTSSVSEEHKNGSVVENICFSYANEFFRRIKSEIAPLITENVVEDLDYTQFLKNIKSFYSAKGSLNGHRIIFKILFNDKKYNVLLNAWGSGAKLKINNYNKYIPKNPPPQIVSGGIGYDNRRDPITNEFINSPIIDVFGSGSGALNDNNLRPNKTAVIKVTGIDNNGTITSIEVVDSGEDYIGPITSRVRNRSFSQDQRVYNTSGTGQGRVEYWDGFKNELVLYDVIGYFSSDDEIVGIGAEEPRAIISRAFIGTSSIRSGVETISEEQNIEFPREYTFKTSNSKIVEKKVLKCKILSGQISVYGELPTALDIVQDSDTLFGVKGVNIEVDNIIPLRDNTYEFEVSSNSDLNNLYLPPSTEVIKSVSTNSSDFVITVDDASRFPVTNGILSVNGVLIYYTDRSINQFFGCSFFTEETISSIDVGTRAVSWGRKKYTIEWSINQQVSEGEFRYYKNNLYKAINSGTTGSLLGPTHTSGVERDGSYADGNLEPVSWQYVSSNVFRHALYVKSTNDLIKDTVFELLAMPGDVVITAAGALHTKQQYIFADLDSPNTQNFYFVPKEISDRLSIVLSSNFNRTGNSITDSRLPSYESFVGFNSIYDYGEYIYVPSSGIPRWWNEIVDLSQQDIPQSELNKVSFTNQKLISRYKKSTLLDATRVVVSETPTKKAIGFNADAIQVNSYKGSTVNYGYINNFVIADGGDYEVPINPQSSGFIFNQFPSFVIEKDEIKIEVTNQNLLTKLSSRFSNINFNKLAEFWQNSGELVNFTSKPVIEIVNNNPRKTATVLSSSITTGNNTFTVTYLETDLQFETADKVIYNNVINNIIPDLINNGEYYVRKIQQISSTQVKYSLHTSESDSIIGINAIKLQSIDNDVNFSFGLVGETINPIDFESAEFDLSFNQETGSIDNIIIRNSGNGYVEAPTVKLVGGGKLLTPEIVIPYSIDGVKIIEMRGKLTSFTNFYNNNSYLIDSFTNITEIFDISPKVTIDSGSGAEASAYVANGKLASIVLVKKGKNYYTKPIIKVIGNGKDAVVEASIENGEISGFQIINPGTGYTTPPKIEIVPSGSGGLISARLNEWTFNLVERMNRINRIDSFGGYVYNESDYSLQQPDSNNILNLTVIEPSTDLPPSLDDRQYLLLSPTDKLLAKYTIEQRKGYLDVLYPNQTFTYQTQAGINEILSKNIHSPAVCVSYDGVPVYGKKGHAIKFDSTSNYIELKSRYKLKYSTTDSPGSIQYTVNNTTYYVNRIGGPSVQDYPIGSFIEDYEFIPGNENDLDIHNGRFCVTPEYPAGRYCYFATTASFDDLTNQIISQNNLNYNGFPYFIGDTYSSQPDSYPNKGCRTNDKMPKVFTRSFDKKVDPFEIPGVFKFDGLAENARYPKENVNYDRTILRSSSLSPGSVDSVIIESPGSEYKIGDSVLVDNTLTFGSGFGAFVSKILGKTINSVTPSADKRTVEVITNNYHGLSVGDYVYLDYNSPNTPVSINLYESSFSPVSTKIKPSENISILLSEGAISKYSDKKFFSIALNAKYKYRFNIPNIPYTFTLDVDKSNEVYVIEEGSLNESTNIVFDASKLPNIVYLHIGNYIYEIVTTNEYVGEYRIEKIDNSKNSFTFTVPQDPSGFEISGLFYSAKSRGASGGVFEISISNGGYNYRKLPALEVISDISGGTGSGAVIQANSSTIGRIRNVSYLTSGGGFTSNETINHYLDLPATAKIINNFEIYEVEVVDNGSGYNDALKILVNGSESLAQFNINVQLGVIISIDVIDGGANFETIPTVEIVSSTGTGCVLRAKIRRKELNPGEILKGNVNSQIFPVQVLGKTLNFDSLSSTLEFDEVVGSFKENDIVYTDNGKKYGRIISIRRPKAYAKTKSYATLENYRNDISGNSSEFLQKITDSNIYQDWSYIISSSRDTKEWREQVETNTHPAGNNLFGKKIIERRKFFFDRPEDVFKTSIIFTTKLVDEILLKVKLSPCKEQTITVPNIDNFNEGDYIFGTISEAIGKIVEKTEYSFKVELRTEKKFVLNEIILIVPKQFSYGIESATTRSIAFWNGIMQEPDVSYESTFKYVDQNGNELNPPQVDLVIPKFEVNSSDKLTHYKLSSNYLLLDSIDLTADQNVYYPTISGNLYQFSSDFLDKTIFSISGVVQNPDKLEINQSQSYVKFLETPKHNARLFGITNNALNKLVFTGNSVSNTFTINYTPQSNCNLLIFYSGVHQTQLLTDFTVNGNVVTFDESLQIQNIFGWYVDEVVSCELVNAVDLIANRITGSRGCETKNFTEFIHSSAVKTPTSLYEQRKEYLDGTIYPDTNKTTLYGFKTKFTYTSPEYSRSFVEVLDAVQFTGVDKSFKLTRIGGVPYTPVKGKDSLMVYVDNLAIDQDQYSVTGDTISFVTAYPSSSTCTIIDFDSTYRADYTGVGASNLDRLDVQHNGVRTKFNLSDRGVPQYTKNIGDVFAIRNGVLQRPDKRHQTVLNNKITFNDAPEFEDTTELIYFNRQLNPLPTKNVVLDDFYCFDGTRKDFPLTIDGIIFYPVNVYNLFVVRNGVYQKAGVDYRLGTTNDVRQVEGLDSYTLDGSHIVFDTAPEDDDEIIVFYSYDGLNQNLKIDSFKYFDGVQDTFPLTKDFISTTPTSSNHIQVYRNGVYQYSEIDYTVSSINGGPRIIFTTPPLETDEIFVTQYNTSSYFINKTINFTQVNNTTIENQSNELLVESDVILIYKSGILITDGWQVNYTNQTILFDQTFIIDNKVRIFVVKNCAGELDKFFKFDGVQTTFPITKNVVSKTPYSADHIQVYKNGVYQYSGTDYTVSTTNGGPKIIFTTAPLSTDKIFITNFHSSSTFVDATSGFTQLSPTEFQYSTTLSHFLLIFDNGVIKLQDSYSVNYSTNTITFNQPVTLSKLKIYFITNPVKKLDTFRVVDGINTIFPLTSNYQSVTLAHIDILVYRNGVFQYPQIDYNITTSFNGDVLINFTTAPAVTDKIFIIESEYDDITGYFVQDNPTTLGNVSTLSQNKFLLIYKKGILQNSDSFTYDYVNNKIYFTETFAFDSSVKIYSVSKAPYSTNESLDGVYEVDGIRDTFPLTLNKNSYITPSSGTNWPQVQVVRNGVFQVEGYTTSNVNGGPRIIFDSAPKTTDNIFITAFAENEFVELPSNLLSQTNSTTITYTGARNLSNGTVLIFIEGVLQNFNTYIKNGNIFTFTESVTLSSVKFYHLENTNSLDSPYVKNGITNTFPLTYDNESINANTINSSLVYRNGVYQYPGTDYNLLSTNGGPRIEFTTAPNQSETIFIQNFTDSSGLQNLTSQFSAVTSTTYQFNGTLSVEPLLVFCGGILQSNNSWSFNTVNQRLVFSEVPNGSVSILQIKNCPVILNEIIASSNKTRYQLKNGRKNYIPADAESLFVYINGIVQIPGVSYDIDGSELVFLNGGLTAGTPLVVIDASAAGLRVIDNIESSWEDENYKYLKTLENYQTIDSSKTLLAINGIIQDPNNYSVNDFVLRISNELKNSWSVIQALNSTQSNYVRLDSIDSTLTEFNDYKEIIMFDNYLTISNYNSVNLIVNICGVVQIPDINYSITGTVLRFNSPTVNISDVEIFNIFNTAPVVVDRLSDLHSKYVDTNGLVHTKFIIRNNYFELVNSTGILAVYNSIVLEPDVDYFVYNYQDLLLIELITQSDINLNQLNLFDVSKSPYEKIDSLNSLVSQSNGNYTLRLTKNYQTISGLSSDEVLLQLNGVVQNISSYNIINSTITVIGTNYENAKIYDLSGANLRFVDYLSEDFTTPTFKLTQNYSTLTPSNISDVFVLRDAVLQNPTEDYTAGSGFITFTTPINKLTDVFILYNHSSEEIIPVTPIPYNICTDEDTYSLPYIISESDKNKLILYMNGVPNFYQKDFTISGTVLSLNGNSYVDDESSIFLVKYVNLTNIDDLVNCPDGIKTKFKLLYKGKNVIAKSSADILVSAKGVVQRPDSDYVIERALINNVSVAKWVNFEVPLDKPADTFFVRMYENTSIPLSKISSTTYQIQSSVSDYQNLYVFANGNWMLPTKDYTIVNNSVILQTEGVDVFAIEFSGIVKLLDEVHTPYDSTRTRFNLFLNQENFVPLGTIEDDSTPDETSILVVKNNKVLDPGVDYILSGDIESQIVFTVAPTPSDIYMIKAIGSVKKLSSITTGFNGSTKSFNLTHQKNSQLLDYYPNAMIERPRDHENQILVIKDGFIQSPIFDYYIDNNKLIFNTAPASNTSKIVILDFMGTVDDVKVDKRLYQVEIGDTVHLDCSIDENRNFVFERTVTEIISPTVMNTTPVQTNMFRNFSANVNYSGGKVFRFNITNGGVGFVYPTNLVTKGSGAAAMALTKIDPYQGGKVNQTPIIGLEIIVPGYNIYKSQVVVPTVRGFVYRKSQLVTTNFTKATSLTSNISSTAESIPVLTTNIFDVNPLQIQIISPTGSGASFIPYVVDGYLRKIDIVNGGIGYDERYIQVNVIGGNGTGAVLEPVLDAIGTITDLIIRNNGVGYDSFRAFLNSEVIEYTDKTNTELIGVTRNILNYNLSPGITFAHNQNDRIYSGTYL